MEFGTTMARREGKVYARLSKKPIEESTRGRL